MSLLIICEAYPLGLITHYSLLITHYLRSLSFRTPYLLLVTNIHDQEFS